MPLPPGLILNPATGELTGTPTAAGTYSVNLRVRDALGTSREVVDEVTINAYIPQTYIGSLGPLMDTRVPIAMGVTHAGGTAPFTFEVFSGTLPSGITLDTGTGQVEGSPDTPGDYAATLRATDALNQPIDLVLIGEVMENLILTYPAEQRIVVGSPVELVPAVAGGEAPFGFESTGLEHGLSIENGIIAGTPDSNVDQTVTVTVTGNHGYTATAQVNLVCALPPVLAGVFVRGTFGEAYSATFAGTQGHAPLTYSATGLPPGLSINSATGEVTGTPTFAGNFPTPAVTVTDDVGNTASRTNPIVVAAPLSLTGTPGPATREVAYSFRPTAAGGWPSYTFALLTGALPEGLSIDPASGRISGIPTTQEVANFTVRMTDADGHTEDWAASIDVAGDLFVSGTLPAFATVGNAYSGTGLSVSGGSTPYVWSISAGALPTGLSLSTTTGAITGTPNSAGNYTFTVKARDANDSYDTVTQSVSVKAQPSLSGSLADGSTGRSYSDAYTLSGGHLPVSWSHTGTLPTGLGLNSSTGRVSGVPSSTGDFTFTVIVTDDQGNTDSRAGTVSIYAPPSISASYPDRAEVGVAYSGDADATGGKPSKQWRYTGSLPPGLSMSASSGAISGTPTSGSGSYEFTAIVTDGLGVSDSTSQSIDLARRIDFSGNRYSSGATQGLPYTTGAWSASLIGGHAPLTFSIASGALAPGLSLDSSDGSIGGTPTTPGTYYYRIRVTDDLGVTSLADSEGINVHAPIEITGPAPRGTRGRPYVFQPGLRNGWGPFVWSVQSGALPPGTSINSSTGRISGTITSGSSASFNLLVRDLNDYAYGDADAALFSMSIAAPVSLSISGPRGTQGASYSSTGASATAGWSPYTYAIASGALPPGISMSSSTGNFSGTPSANGTYGFTVRVTDADGGTDTASGSIAVSNPLAITSGYASPRTEDAAYSSTPTRNGGWGPFSFSKISGTIPPGLSLRASDGNLSGTPTTPGTYAFTIRCTDDDGNIDDRAMSIVIASAVANLVVTASPDPAFDTVGTFRLAVTASASSTASTTGGSGAKTFSWARISGYTGFDVSGASTATLTVSKTSNTNFDQSAVYRVTARDAGGDVDTYDVLFHLKIDRADEQPL